MTANTNKHHDLWLAVIAIGYAVANVCLFDQVLHIGDGWSVGIAWLCLTPPVFATLSVIVLTAFGLEIRWTSILLFIGWMFVVGFVNWQAIIAAANAC